MAEQWPVAIHFFGAYFDNSPFENGRFLLSSLLVWLIQSKMCCCCYWHCCCCYLCYWRRFWYSCWCIVSSKCLPAIIFVHKFVSPKIDAYTASWNGFVKCVKFWLCKILTKHSIIALFSKSFFFVLFFNSSLDFFRELFRWFAHSPI